jgi:hypothetical protein
MIGLLGFELAVLASPFKSKLRLEAENAVLRQWKISAVAPRRRKRMPAARSIRSPLRTPAGSGMIARALNRHLPL